MAAIDTTTTTKTDISTQLGTQLTVTDDTKKVTVGTFVTDVSIHPYIAPRIVAFFAYNLRPDQVVHVFFDSVLVDQYCAPGVIPTSISDTSNYRSIEKKGNYGEQIKTDTFGQVAGWFNIPEATFKTGDRILTICDADSIVRGSDAFTTTAAATFTASNLNVTKETVTLTTVNPQISSIPVKNQVIKVSSTEAITILPDVFIGSVTGNWWEPIAQGLTINTPSSEAGIFATSIDIYFKQKPSSEVNGISVYLCETTNGYPDGSRVLPFSTVNLKWDDIVVSTDATLPTKFTFDSPVFLNNGLEYAFIVKPDAGDPDYWVYSAKLGDVDIVTGKQMYSQPVIGTAFYGATDRQWTAVQNEYIKFNLHRAKFTNASGAGGDAYFTNSNTDYLSVYNVGYACTSYGILPGDVAYQATGSSVGSINTAVHGIVESFSDVKSLIYVANSTGSFVPDTVVQIHRFANNTVMASPGPNTSTLIAYANTGSLHDIKVNALVPQLATITPAGTSLSFKYKGASNTYVADSTEYNVDVGMDNEFFDKERVIASKTNEGLYLGGKSFNLHAKMQTDSELISPAIDMVRNQQLVIGNDVEPISFIYDEFFNNGTAKSKYISQPITLAAGQDAEDIHVILTAFRPNGTDIQVWVKFLNGEDSDPLSAKTWVPLINDSAASYSAPGNTSDLKELVFTVPKYYGMIPLTGIITTDGTTINGSGTKFEVELKPDWFVNMLGTEANQEITRKITSITSNTLMTISDSFNVAYTDSSMFLVPPPTTAWLSTDNTVALTGDVTTSTTSNIITGSGTNFTGELQVGSIIQVEGDQQAIISIANTTSLAVGTPWSSSGSGLSASLISAPGVTYLNSSSSLYSSFKRFQIKVVLQTNDSSQVPMLKDIRALALQL